MSHNRPMPFALLALVAAAPAAGAPPVSFARDVAPVLRNECATCHMTGEEPGGMKLYPSAAYRSLVKAPSQESRLQRVSPGDPQASYLLHKLEGTHLDVGGTGVQMPFGLAPLAKETRDTIRRWIAQGAKDS
jgi:hypothetical protein